MIFWMSMTAIGSTPAKGSSSRMKRGLVASARAISTRRRSPPDKLFLSRRPQRRELATLVLVDSSLSTDAWAAGRRVLDVARESLLALGEALCGPGDPLDGALAMGAFYSHTRRSCHYLPLKGFLEPWQAGQRRVAALRPTG